MAAIRQFFVDLFASHSPASAVINTLFLRFLILAGVILALVIGLVVVAVIRFNAGRHPGLPRKIFGNKPLEIAWTLIPLGLVALFFFLGLAAMKEINAPIPTGHTPDIEIVARQWWWELRYPKQGFVAANELHVPVGEKLLVEITSADVVHDWSVPELARKIDAIPGRMSYLWLQADRPGLYLGTCNEYCGAEHAQMLIRVVAESRADYERWVAREQAPPATPASRLAVEGHKLFVAKTCGNCHTATGAAGGPEIGPDLTHVASRQTLLSGTLPNNRANLSRWLADPQRVKPGAHMPNFRLSPHQVDALVAYLRGLE